MCILRILFLFLIFSFHFSANSQTIQWAKNVGGSGSDVANKSSVDLNGNLYVTGSFQGANVDFDPGPGTFLLSSAGLKDGYVAKYDKNGIFKWAFKIGGTNQDEVNDVALDHSGNILVTGYFRGAGVDFDPSSASFLLNSNGESGGDPGYGGDIFLAKYDTLGNFKWAFNCGGPQLGDNGTSVSTDNNDNVLMTGYFRETVDFDPSSGVANLLSSQGTLFVAKYSQAGIYQWAFNAGQGDVDNTGFKVLADNQNNVVVTGFFQGINIDFDPGPGIATLSSAGGFEFFLAKYSPAGAYLWARSAGGSGTDVGRALAIDAVNDIYVTGDYNSSTINFNGTQPANVLINHGSNDLFLVKFSSAGQHLWSFSVGSSAIEVGSSVTRDNAGNIIISGGFSGTNVDFDPSINTVALSSQGGYDMYAVKYDPTGNYLCSFRVGGTGDDIGNCVSSYNNFYYFTGQFQGPSVDFDPLVTTALLNGSGTDGFLSKYDWNITQPNGAISGNYSCLTNKAQLTFTSTAGTAPYTLYINNGSATSTYTNVQSGIPFILVPTPTITTTYTLTGIRDATFCAGMTLTNLPVTIIPNGVTITTSGNTSICKFDSVQLSVGGGINYQWIPSTGLSNASIANPKASPLVTTTYKVIVTSSTGCKDSTSLLVTVRPPLTLSVLPTNATYCRGDSVQLIASGGAFYHWTPATGLSDADIANPKASPPATISYKIVVTSVDGCKDSITKTVIKNPSPVVTVSPGGAICPADSIQLNASGGTGFQWRPSAGLDNSSIANPKASPAATTLYTVVVNNAQGCKDSGYVNVSLKSKPVITITQPLATCKGDSVQLIAAGGVSYHWSPSIGLANANIPNPKAAPTSTTNYVVAVSGANSCIDSATATLTINQPPVMSVSPAGAVCAGDSLQLTASGGSHYQWSPSAGLSNTVIAAPKASPAVATTYKVAVFTVDNCLDSGFVTVNVKAKPIVTIDATGPLCNGDTLQLHAHGGSTYQWFPVGGLSDPAIASPFTFTQSTTNYNVVVADAQGCTDSAKTTVSVFQKPTLFLGKDTVICPAENILLDAALPSATGYLWSTGAITSTVIINQPDTFTVAVTISGCRTPATDTIVVNRLPLPVVALGKDTAICSFYTLRVAAVGSYVSNYLWNTGATDSAIFINRAGNYIINASNKCGSVSDDIKIDVSPCSDDIFFPTAFTPNGDSHNNFFKAAYLQGVTVFDYELAVFNRWGQLVFKTNDVSKGWDGKINGTDQSTGVFVWLARYKKIAGGIQIMKKGTLVLIR